MRQIHHPFLSLLLGLFWVCCLSASAGAKDKEAKFTNPSPELKPLDSAAQDARIAEMMGKPPELNAKEFKKFQKGKVIIHKVESRGKGQRYEAIARIDAPPSVVMAYMKDFPAHVGDMPHLKKITHRWNGNVAIVEQTLKIALSTFWYELSIRHCKNSLIEWELLRGDIKETTGYYKFFPFEGGNKTLIVYRVYTDPGLPIPQFILNLLTKSSMPDVVEAIRKASIKRHKETK